MLTRRSFLVGASAVGAFGAVADGTKPVPPAQKWEGRALSRPWSNDRQALVKQPPALGQNEKASGLFGKPLGRLEKPPVLWA